MSSSDHVVGMVTSSSSCETVASSSSPLDVTTAVNSNEMGSERQDVCFKRKEGSLSTDGGPDCSGNVTLVASDSDGLSQVEEEGEEEGEKRGGGNYWSSNESRVSTHVDGSSRLMVDSSLDLSSPDEPNADGGGESSWNVGPLQKILIPVTENDPLGVFTPPPPIANPPPSDTNVTRSSDNDNGPIVSGQWSLLSDTRLFVEGDCSKSAGLNGMILRDSRRRPSSEVEPSPSVGVVSEESTVAVRRPKSSSSRGEMFGSVMRTATRLFSRYNDLRKSITTQGSKVDSGSLNSINSVGSLDPTIANSSSTGASESSDGDHASSDDREGSVPGGTGYGSVVVVQTPPPKSRLRVPGLYAPLGTSRSISPISALFLL